MMTQVALTLNLIPTSYELAYESDCRRGLCHYS